MLFNFFKNWKFKMSTITINNSTYEGDNVSVKNNVVIIDGQKINTDEKIINISINGNINSLDVSYASRINVTGDVNELDSNSGDIIVHGNVNSKIDSNSGDIQIDGDVTGNIETTSGDVKCGNVTGSIETLSGDIKHR